MSAGQRRTSSHTITDLADGEVFVFGSNASGAHGGGAARTAYERFGAVWGQGHGLQGRSYGIDTMSGWDAFVADVRDFLAFAADHPELTFLLTPVGTGIAGWDAARVAPLFTDAPDNVLLPEPFATLLDR
ncbi:A1S_2505 family phage non-structural protein [Luteimicrobium sp. DT211]|uniref:A1S_2505 family phage non-structural protein n=1 Tax=Luteimicrobium sp. DT211 TaxID=3393412 RepID=UPI003CF1BDD1